MTEGRHLALLQRLMPAQQGVHHGSPGGLGNALTPEELEALHRHARESVLFIGTQFSILYTFMYSPAEAATPRA